MEFEAYKHHIYFFLIVAFAGLILQVLIEKLIFSLNPDTRRNLGKAQKGSQGFFSKIGIIFSWTVSLYLGFRMYYEHVFPDELFSFLRVIIKMESVVLIMFFLSHGINHILINIAKDKKTAPDDKILASGTAKKTAKLPVKNPLAWVIAFIVSTLGLNVIYFSSLINLLIFAAIILFAIIFLYRSSEGGHQIVNGFIGYFYLKNEQKSCDNGEPFMLVLEDGKPYEVKKISLFHTSFKTDSNTSMIKNNSLLMILNYGFKEFEVKPNTNSHNSSFDKANDLQYEEDVNESLNKI